jgi:hypothetical protein
VNVTSLDKLEDMQAPAYTKTGYELVWKDAAGNAYGPDATFTGETYLILSWNKVEPETETFIVTFDADNGEDPFEVEVVANETVAEPETPVNGDKVFLGWFEEDAEEAFNFETPITAAITLTGKWEDAPVVIEPITIKGVSLTLNGSIGMNLYLDNVSEEMLENGVVKLNYKGAEVVNATLSECEFFKLDEAKGWYCFTYPVLPKEIFDEMTVQFLYNDEVVMLKGGANEFESYTYSVDTWIELTIARGTETDKNLAKALKQYGECAAYYLNYTTEAPSPVFADTTNVETLSVYKTVGGGKLPSGYSVGISLTLESETSINLYIFGAKADGLLTFTVDGEEVEAEYNDAVGRYEVRVNDITAKNLGTAHTFVIKSESTEMTIGYSALTWAYQVIKSNSNEAEVNTAKALYEYFVAAVPAIG